MNSASVRPGAKRLTTTFSLGLDGLFVEVFEGFPALCGAVTSRTPFADRVGTSFPTVVTIVCPVTVLCVEVSTEIGRVKSADDRLSDGDIQRFSTRVLVC